LWQNCKNDTISSNRQILRRLWLLNTAFIAARIFVSRASPPHCAAASSGPGPPHYRGFMFTLARTSVDRTPLDELSSRRRDLYLSTHNTHKRQTSVHPQGFKPTIAVSERPQTHALGRAATKIGYSSQNLKVYSGLRLLVSFTLRPPQFQLYIITWSAFNRKRVGFQIRSGSFTRDENSFPLPVIETRFLGHPSRIQFALSTQLSWFF